MIIGDKDNFAIKIHKIDHTYGKIAFFINGFELGYYNEEVNILTVMHQLLKTVDYRDLNLFEKYNENLTEIFNFLLNSDDEKYDPTILSFGPSFDDFYVRGLTHKDEIFIIWKLSETPFFEYEFESNEIRSGKIKMDTIKTLCQEVFEEMALK